ncbi:hypothetical protein BJY00DRAFT_100379 [Aspergillus carlsbadensis]|nr:hypothetical protein BJY00DRAFT_100379 [Aspergillus carlsbadensis]
MKLAAEHCQPTDQRTLHRAGIPKSQHEKKKGALPHSRTVAQQEPSSRSLFFIFVAVMASLSSDRRARSSSISDAGPTVLPSYGVLRESEPASCGWADLPGTNHTVRTQSTNPTGPLKFRAQLSARPTIPCSTPMISRSP